MTRDDQFVALFLLIANLWLIAANLTNNTYQRGVCVITGGLWLIALFVGATT